MTTRTTRLDQRMMGLALEAATKGRTSPNPRVGAVVALGDEVIATGFHARAGEPHAEIHALRAAGQRARGATLYCTLEPCNHHGRTPPCTDAILAAGVARVVIGCGDPATHGTTSGAPRLEASGVRVTVGVRHDAALELVEDFACLATRQRPLVTLKAALTLDGRMATRSGDSKWITGEAARRHGHRLRDQSDAILVGVGTVLADDPRLDVRLTEGTDPIRVILDTHLRTPTGARVIIHESKRPTWIIHGPSAPPARRAALARSGVELIEVPSPTDRIDLGEALRELGRREIMRLLVEGGARTHGAFLDAGLVDRAEVFIAPSILGDVEAPPLAIRAFPPQRMEGLTRLEAVQVKRFGRDTLIRGRLAAVERH